ncbi:MAG TPA: hypothetical protein VNY84_07680 [Acidimicrobiales bacterium]|jgi:hypothetical protein|nr:hypothetical protein [Acidimicrobiales bacterium]
MDKRTAIGLAGAAVITIGTAVGATTIGHGAPRAAISRAAAGAPASTDPANGPLGPAAKPIDPPTNSTTAGRGVLPPKVTTSTTVKASEMCRNSTDPACGAFRWDPVPRPNAPMTAVVEVSPAHPAVGQKVTFTIRAHDPDASQGGMVAWGFGDGAQVHVEALRAHCEQYGPWTPPAAVGQDWVTTQTWVYRQVGNFSPSFTLASTTPGIGGCPDPYASVATATTTLAVTQEATQDSQYSADFWCDPSTRIAGARYEQTDEPLKFSVEGSCPQYDPAQASVSADVTNVGDQPVYFPGGVDVVVHLDHGDTQHDVHLTDPATTTLAPGDHVHLSKHVDVERTGSYWVGGTIRYRFAS